MLLAAVTYVALAMSVLSWLVFVLATYATLRIAGAAQAHSPEAKLQGFDPEKVLESAGALAAAFKIAGPAPTAAAMSLACLVVAAATAWIDKL
jgi:hypothetical protein